MLLSEDGRHQSLCKSLNSPAVLPLPNAPETLHDELKTLLADYDVNAAAASVKVYAVKPQVKAAKSCCESNMLLVRECANNVNSPMTASRKDARYGPL